MFSKFFAWVSRKPRTAFWSTFAVALVLGAAIGGAGSETDSTSSGEQAATGGQTAALEGERDKLRAQFGDVKRADDATARAEVAEGKLKQLTAKAEVPDFTGQDADVADNAELVSELDWKIKHRTRATASTEPGTVIAQSPRAGRTLKAGKTIMLTVARKPPPKPRQWVTVISESGAGQKRTDEFRIPGGVKARVRYTFGGESNDTLFIKTPDEGSDDFGDLLVNDIGAHSGTSRLYGKSGTYYLEIDGDSWSVEVQVFKRP